MEIVTKNKLARLNLFDEYGPERALEMRIWGFAEMALKT